jgi:hypothetical protein
MVDMSSMVSGGTVGHRHCLMIVGTVDWHMCAFNRFAPRRRGLRQVRPQLMVRMRITHWHWCFVLGVVIMVYFVMVGHGVVSIAYPLPYSVL